MSQEFRVPRFCPKGCGETVIATQPTTEELKMLQKQNPAALRFWHIKCSKCGFQTFIGEMN